MAVKPRGWQKRAFRRFLDHDRLAFLLEATPGAGKTIFSALCANSIREAHGDVFVIAVVPTTALKESFIESYNDAALTLTSVLKEGRGRPRAYDGAVVTYQQLPNLVSTFEIWARNGQRLMFVFDEIHHASDENRWGAASESCGRIAEKILAMTGTPFRGDGRRISFVRYSDDNLAIADFSYGYRNAVADSVCRELFFAHDDGVAEYIFNEQEEKVRVSEAEPEQISKVSSAIFAKEAEWLNKVILKADDKLNDYRAINQKAGGIVICRPGVSDSDDRHLVQVAKAVETLTGEAPTVITHDDKDANEKISRFRKSADRWIVAVRKISEGVDIKRLRVMVIASYPSTELLFRQLVGRVVRVEDSSSNEDAMVYMAKFPQLVEWATKISEEAKVGARERNSRESGDCLPKEPGDSRLTLINGSHEHGGGVSLFGEQYTASEVSYAERLKRNDSMLVNMGVAQIAHLIRKLGVQVDEQEASPKPVHQIKIEKRKEIDRLAKRLAYSRKENSSSPPDFRSVFVALFRRVGVKNMDDLMDNCGVEKMDEAIAVLKSSLRGVEDDAA